MHLCLPPHNPDFASVTTVFLRVLLCVCGGGVAERMREADGVEGREDEGEKEGKRREKRVVFVVLAVRWGGKRRVGWTFPLFRPFWD